MESSLPPSECEDSADHIQHAENALQRLKDGVHFTNGWRIALEHKSGVEVFVRDGLSPGEKFPVFKGEKIIQGFPPRSVFSVVAARNLWDDWFVEGNLVDNLSDNTSLTYMVMKGIKGSKERDLALVEKLQQTGDGTIYFVSSSVDTARVPRQPNRTRAVIHLNGFVMEKLSREDGSLSTKLTYMLMADVKGWVPGPVANKLLAQRPLVVNAIDDYLQKFGPPGAVSQRISYFNARGRAKAGGSRSQGIISADGTVKGEPLYVHQQFLRRYLEAQQKKMDADIDERENSSNRCANQDRSLACQADRNLKSDAMEQSFEKQTEIHRDGNLNAKEESFANQIESSRRTDEEHDLPIESEYVPSAQPMLEAFSTKRDIQQNEIQGMSGIFQEQLPETPQAMTPVVSEIPPPPPIPPVVSRIPIPPPPPPMPSVVSNIPISPSPPHMPTFVANIPAPPPPPPMPSVVSNMPTPPPPPPVATFIANFPITPPPPPPMPTFAANIPIPPPPPPVATFVANIPITPPPPPMPSVAANIFPIPPSPPLMQPVVANLPTPPSSQPMQPVVANIPSPEPIPPVVVNIPTPPSPPHRYNAAVLAAKRNGRKLATTLEGWTFQREVKGIRLYTHEFPGRKMPIFRGDGRIAPRYGELKSHKWDASLGTDILAVIRSAAARKVWDDRFERSRQVEYLSDNDILIASEMKGKFTISDRELSCVLSNDTHPDTSELWSFGCSVVDPRLAVNSKSVRAHLDLAVWRIVPIAHNSFSITYVVQMNIKGSVPSSVAKAASKETALCVGRIESFLGSYGFPPYVLSIQTNRNGGTRGIRQVGEAYYHQPRVYEHCFESTFSGNGEAEVRYRLSSKMYENGAEVSLTGPGRLAALTPSDVPQIADCSHGFKVVTVGAGMISVRVSVRERGTGFAVVSNGRKLPMETVCDEDRTRADHELPQADGDVHTPATPSTSTSTPPKWVCDVCWYSCIHGHFPKGNSMIGAVRSSCEVERF